jgi:cyanophycinase
MVRLFRLLCALLVTAAVVGSPGASPAAAEPASGPGTIILVGGALADDNAAIYGEFVRLAGGPGAHIGILSASSATPHWSANAVGKVLESYGAEATWIPISVKKKGSGEDPSIAALAASMDAYFFAGGDQFRYVQSMIRADGSDGAVLAAVRARFEAGAPIAGTSAGMQIFAGPDMITGGLSYYGVRDGAQPGYFDTDEVLGYWPAGGFNFFTSGLVDTHFDARGRDGRSIRLAADTGHDRVFGVGEDTALVVTGAGTAGESMRVIGTNGVSLLDLGASTVSEIGGYWAIAGVRWSYLTDGDGYAPAVGQITKASAPLVPDAHTAAPGPTSVFSSYAMLNAALDLADAGLSTSTVGTTAETGPRFAVELTKGAGFSAYTVDGSTAASFSDLDVAIRVG